VEEEEEKKNVFYLFFILVTLLVLLAGGDHDLKWWAFGEEVLKRLLVMASREGYKTRRHRPQSQSPVDKSLQPN